MTDGARRQRFEAAYRELYAPICGYVLRRVREPDNAAEVIAETFATLWRRFDRCPRGAELRPWVFGVARRVIANQRRGERRRSALGERLSENLDRTVRARWQARSPPSASQTASCCRSSPGRVCHGKNSQLRWARAALSPGSG